MLEHVSVLGVRNLTRVDVDLSRAQPHFLVPMVQEKPASSKRFIFWAWVDLSGPAMQNRSFSTTMQRAESWGKSAGARDRCLLVLRKTGTLDCGPALAGKMSLQCQSSLRRCP